MRTEVEKERERRGRDLVDHLDFIAADELNAAILESPERDGLGKVSRGRVNADQDE